ncbi:septum formation family protein [Streptomyces sp. NPDC057428]|uniref:septum formation family protein n=1 Tax=Streptomyces sp. NPDC057428 TaxID=3346129 RepID=UPI0036A04DA2
MSLGVTSRSLRGISVVVALLAIGTSGCSDGADEDGANKHAVSSLATGDCYNLDGKSTGSEEPAVQAVPCAEPHLGQIVDEFTIDDEKSFPGDDAVAVIADGRCPGAAQKFAPDPWALPQGVDVFYYPPSKTTWAAGDRAVSCAYTSASGTFSGSLKSDPLDADQLAYLKGSAAVYEALWAHQPEGDKAADDLPGYKVQARAVAAALDTHVQTLRGIEQPETGKLRALLEEAAAEWKTAASAGDADTFQTAYDAAFAGIDPSKSIAARKELKLATTVPAVEAEGWAG